MSLFLQKIVLPLTGFALEVDLELSSRVTALFGPSGAGKTSLLDLIAGLRRARSAVIRLNETVLTDTIAGLEVPVRRRRIGYVPQDMALFPHLSVRRNLLYGHRLDVVTDSLFQFDHVARTLELNSLLTRSIATLSGGEKQRVTLGRALLSSPQLLLLDEPLSSLDVRLKSQILPFLKRVRDEFPIPMLYVTHSADEVAALCDEVIVLERGRFSGRGKPGEIFGDRAGDSSGSGS
jgi:molybdate transport system ATP-binding protein